MPKIVVKNKIVNLNGDEMARVLWNKIENEFSKFGVEIIYFPYTTHTSSTILRKILSKS